MNGEQINDTEMQVNDKVESVKDNSETVAGGASVGDSVSTGEADEIKIPDSWETDIKDFLGSIQDLNGKKAIFNKIKNLDTGYQKKYSEVAEMRKTLEADRKSFDSDRQFLANYRDLEKAFGDNLSKIYAQYGSVPAYINNLYQMDLMASQDPYKFIVDFCDKVGVDSVEKLASLLNGNQGQQIRQVRDIQNLENKMNQQFEQRLNEERERAKVEAMVESFAKDHEHFEKLRPMMAKLSNAMPDKGLQELYDMAISLDPELVALKQAKAEAERAKVEQAEVEKAKQAIGISAKPVGKTVQEKNWRQVLKEELGK